MRNNGLASFTEFAKLLDRIINIIFWDADTQQEELRDAECAQEAPKAACAEYNRGANDAISQWLEDEEQV